MSDDVEQRVMEQPRNQPPTPGNPALMYTGETLDEFFARRQPLEALWNQFMASNGSKGFLA